MATNEKVDGPLVDLKFDRPPASLQKSAKDALTTAKSYVIDSTDMYELAAGELQQVKKFQKSVEAQRTAITEPLNAALKSVNALFKAPKEWLEQAEVTLKTSMMAFQRDQERRRIEEQARLEEAARIERARLAEEAAAAEAKAQTEAAALRQQAEQEKAAGNAEAAARLESQADTRKEEGAITAQVLDQTSQLMSAPISTVVTPKVAGISTRKQWCFRITDAALVPREYLVIDEKKIGGVVRALKDAANIPGVEAYEEDVIASRAA